MLQKKCGFVARARSSGRKQLFACVSGARSRDGGDGYTLRLPEILIPKSKSGLANIAANDSLDNNNFHVKFDYVFNESHRVSVKGICALF